MDDGFALATLTWALLVAIGERELGGAGPAAIGTGLVAISREGFTNPGKIVSELCWITAYSSTDFGQDRFAVGRIANDAKAAPEEQASHHAERGPAATDLDQAKPVF